MHTFDISVDYKESEVPKAQVRDLILEGIMRALVHYYARYRGVKQIYLTDNEILEAFKGWRIDGRDFAEYFNGMERNEEHEIKVEE